MNKIRLKTIMIKNFKGQEHLFLDFEGQNANIFGDNATGKTTIYDAITWLLFGKDSHGQSSFDIKPLDLKGEVRDHAAITCVQALFFVNGTEIGLKKTYFEKWSTKRGSAAEIFDGNTSDYYVNEVPTKKYEFERRVSTLVSEDVFRLLTGVTHFCADMDWRERRKVLFDVCGVASDTDIMSDNPRFLPLLEATRLISIDDYKKKLQAERKGLSGVRNDVPVRLDECTKTVEELRDINFSTLRVERDQRVVRKEQLSAKLLKLDHSTLLDTKRNKRGVIQNQLEKLGNDNAAFRNGQLATPTDDGASLIREAESLKRSISRWVAEKSGAGRSSERCDAEVRLCREHWIKVNAQQFDGGACPTCGQALCGELLEQAKEKFKREKETQLKDVVANSQILKQRAALDQLRTEDLTREIIAAEKRLAELGDLIGAREPVVQTTIVDMTGYNTTRTDLLNSIATLDHEIAALTGDSALIQGETRAKIASLAEEITAIEGSLHKEEVLRFAQGRMDELRAEAQEAAVKIEQLDLALFLCEEFMRFKIRFIEESVNGFFKLAQFRLFVEQVNGGLSDCCDVVYDGVPYSSLNNGGRINVGIDVISTLSKHYDISVPLFVDNAESITDLCKIDTQVIRLVVSGCDKKLRCDTWA